MEENKDVVVDETPTAAEKEEKIHLWKMVFIK
jgi:hypothetical protein